MDLKVIKHDFWMIVIWLIAVLADGRSSRKCIGPFAVVVVAVVLVADAVHAVLDDHIEAVTDGDIQAVRGVDVHAVTVTTSFQ